MLDVEHKNAYISGMHKLPPAKRAQMLAMLCEGASMMAVSRVCDVSFNAVKKLLKDEIDLASRLAICASCRCSHTSSGKAFLTGAAT